MKKALFLLAAIGAGATAAQADDGPFHVSLGDSSSIDLYGVLDAALINQNHSYGLRNDLPNQSYSYVGKIYSTAPSRTDVVNGGLQDSRVGLKGSIAIADGVKAVFDAETGFDITNFNLNNAAQTLANNPSPSAAKVPGMTQYADSSLNGQMFGRALWAGLQTRIGTLTYGTQDNPTKEALVGFDPAPADTFSPFGESGTVGGGVGSSEESRLHHSIKYKSQIPEGFDVSLAYQFGNDASTSYGHTYAARVGYQNGPFSATAAYSNSADAIVATNGTAVGNIKLNVYDVDGYVVAARYKVSPQFRVSAGYEYFERKAPSDPIQTIGLIWGTPVAATTLGSGFKAGASQDFHIYFVGGDYDITPKLNVALAYYGTNAGALSSALDKDYTINTFTAIVKYHVCKTVDLYAAATSNGYGGALYDTAAAPGYATNVSVVGAGLRVKF